PSPFLLFPSRPSVREPQIGRPIGLAHVPYDGRREPGARLLRPVQEVRRPRHERHVPSLRAGCTGAHGQLADPTGFDVSHVVTYLAVPFRRPTTWKTLDIFQKAGLIWTN